ncbi:MAG TPA: response regulator [Longimicrobiales bacterium]
MKPANGAAAPLVLVASDQEWIGWSIESILGPHGFAVLRASSGKHAIEAFRNSRPDILLLDVDLPEPDGIETCRLICRDPGFLRSTPVLLTTAGPATRQQRLEALKAGAWDIIGFPLDAEELVLKLNAFARAKLDSDHARDHGLLDEATGLYNLRGILQRAREIGADAARHDRPMACIIFALAPGPDDPDLLRRFAETFRDTVRKSDVVGRLGASQFVILATGTGPAGSRIAAERILRVIRERAPDPAGDTPRQFRVGCAGVSSFRETAIAPADLLVRATLALHKAGSSESPVQVADDFQTEGATRPV